MSLAGSGKSRLLLNKAGYYAHNDPDFEGVMFRRTSPPLKAAGGLFSEAKKLYRPLDVNIKIGSMEIDFKEKGGNLKFTHLEHESDAEGNHQGLQYSCIGFDELTHFEQSQFVYLIGRLRSAAEGDSFLLATTNPDYQSWVYHWVSWYLDEAGYFDESKLGKIRYFVTVDEMPVFADSEEELARDYPELCYDTNKVTGELIYIPPLSFCFIGGTIYDNPALIKSNPKYLSALKAQTKVNRMRLLDGCWHAVPEGSNYFQREWLHKLDKKPFGCTEVRAWDLASSEPSDKNRHPDATTSIKMLKTSDNEIVIVGDYDPDSEDPKTKTKGRLFQRPGQRDTSIIRQSKLDGEDCVVVIPKDPAAAGAVAFRELSKKIMAEGFSVKEDPMPSNKSKLKKFEPFSSAAQNGLISIVESTFSRETLEHVYKELEIFDGERSTSSKKDDIPDSAASCYNYIVRAKVHKAHKIPKATNTTQLSKMKAQMGNRRVRSFKTFNKSP